MYRGNLRASCSEAVSDVSLDTKCSLFVIGNLLDEVTELTLILDLDQLLRAVRRVRNVQLLVDVGSASCPYLHSHHQHRRCGDVLAPLLPPSKFPFSRPPGVEI